MSLTSEYEAGDSVASPMPTPIRAANSAPNELVTPQAAVISDHTVTPIITMPRRLQRSTR
jgi:hypothetical protein